MKRRAMDAEFDDETMKNAMAFLKEKLGQDDFGTLKKILGATKDEDVGEDEPQDFKGKPKTGGTMVAADASSDANRKRFNEMFPECARIKVL